MLSNRRILDELNKKFIPKKEPSKNAQSQYGKYLFGGKNVGDYIYGDVIEPDKRLESKILQIIMDYINGHFFSANGKTIINAKTMSYFKMLNQVKNDYPEILMPPIGKTIYRGVLVPFSLYDHLLQYVNVNWKNIDADNVTKQLLSAFKGQSFMFQPHTNVQSFSTNKTTSKGFMYNTPEFVYDDYNSKKLKYPICLSFLLSTTVNKEDYLFNSRFLNVIGRFEEDEVIRVGNHPVECKIEDFHVKILQGN